MFNIKILKHNPLKLSFWNVTYNLAKAFADIDKLAQQCKFRDCSHQSEPGCAVQLAIQKGELTERRLESYLKLKKKQNTMV